jgi:hypothetical protein
MKKLFAIAFFIITALTVSACEICGCGVGNFYMGLLPNFKNHFVGLRYHYMQYHSEMTADKGQFSNDYYNTIELWSGWNLCNKCQLITFVPYHINKQITDDGMKTNNGLGDITVIANYSLMHTRKTNKKANKIEQQVFFGGGLTLPTGDFKVDLSDVDANIGDVNSQSGTGSTGVLLNAIYNITVNNFGASTTVNYKINPTNKRDFKFGNRFTANSFAWYRVRSNGFGIAPNIGVLYEQTASNYLSKTIVGSTGGYATLASGGVEVSHNKLAVGFNTQLPVRQNFSEGQTHLKLRGLLHVTVSL